VFPTESVGIKVDFLPSFEGNKVTQRASVDARLGVGRGSFFVSFP